jgi:hypothetical protein
MRGIVTLERDGKESPAQLGYVYRRDALETGADGEARVRFPGGRVVQLGPSSRFVLDEDSSGLVLQVPKGTLLSSSEDSTEAGRALSIQTPFGRTELGTGKNGLSLQVGKDGARTAPGSTCCWARWSCSPTAASGARQLRARRWS